MNTEQGLTEDLSNISKKMFPSKYKDNQTLPITWEEFEKDGMSFVYGNPNDM